MEQETLGRQSQANIPPAPPLQGQAHKPAQQGQALEADVQAHLGRQLKAVYDDLSNQPVPDRFIQLLDALERKSLRTPDTATSPAVTKVGGA